MITPDPQQPHEASPESGNAQGAELAVIIVSANSGRWLEECLSTVFAAAGGARLDVIVVDNESTDGTAELVRTRFPGARVVPSVNGGFGYGNNRGVEATRAPFLLFLNPDTQVVSGTFAELLELMDQRPEVGLAAVRQVSIDGQLWPSMRRFPSVRRAFGEALFSERWPVKPDWAGERVLDMERYDRETPCDWTSGSFMLARRAALLSSGLFDERFFIYSEEPDLCMRIKAAGWLVVHLPAMTIIHHGDKRGLQPQKVAQDAYARGQYARKHFGVTRRGLYTSALALRHSIRWLNEARRGSAGRVGRECARRALRILVGIDGAPFREPPSTALSVQPTPSRAPTAPREPDRPAKLTSARDRQVI